MNVMPARSNSRCTSLGLQAETPGDRRDLQAVVVEPIEHVCLDQLKMGFRIPSPNGEPRVVRTGAEKQRDQVDHVPRHQELTRLRPWTRRVPLGAALSDVPLPLDFRTASERGYGLASS